MKQKLVKPNGKIVRETTLFIKIAPFLRHSAPFFKKFCVHLTPAKRSEYPSPPFLSSFRSLANSCAYWSNRQSFPTFGGFQQFLAVFGSVFGRNFAIHKKPFWKKRTHFFFHREKTYSQPGFPLKIEPKSVKTLANEGFRNTRKKAITWVYRPPYPILLWSVGNFPFTTFGNSGLLWSACISRI
jgi:hypothetical protein